MKVVKAQCQQVSDAIDAVKDLESKTGVKVKSGLRAGAGAGGGKGGIAQPMYGVPTPPPEI